jgi:hypothetical protein
MNLLIIFRLSLSSSQVLFINSYSPSKPIDPSYVSLRETNVELREENPEPKDQSRKPHQHFLRGSMSHP